jgi:hypothetical protein
MEKVVKVTAIVQNLTNHEKLKSNNQRITVPLRVSYAQEIIANGLGNAFSKNIILNHDNQNGKLYLTKIHLQSNFLCLRHT